MLSLLHEYAGRLSVRAAAKFEWFFLLLFLLEQLVRMHCHRHVNHSLAMYFRNPFQVRSRAVRDEGHDHDHDHDHRHHHREDNDDDDDVTPVRMASS